MTETPGPAATTARCRPPQPTAPPRRPGRAAGAPAPARADPDQRRAHRLIAGVLGLIVVMIFIIQNAHAVSISFLGAHLRLSLAVALLLAAIAGALVMAAAGTARITQLGRIMRRDRRNTQAS